MHLICFTAISFPGFTISKKLTRICLKPSQPPKSGWLHCIHTGCLWGEKSLTAVLSPAWDKRDSGSCLSSYTIKTCLGPHWKRMWDKDTAKSFWSFHTGMNCSSINSNTLAVFLLCYTANSYLIGSYCSYSHLVFSRDLLVTVYCSLDNTCIFTGMPFYFQLLYPSCPSIFQSLNKISWFSGRRCHVKRC